MRWARVSLFALAVAMGVVAVVALRGVTLYTDYLWFADVGFPQAFTIMLISRLRLGLLGGLVFWLFVMANLWIVRGRRRQLHLVGGIMEPLRPGRLLGLAGVATLGVAVLVGLWLSTGWAVVERFRYATPFGLYDPFFRRDAGFYVFTLPFLRLVQQFVFLTLLAGIAASAAGHYLTGGFYLHGDRLTVHPRARLHLSSLLALGFGWFAWNYRLAIWELLFSPRGVAFGASYTDIHAQLPAFRLLIAVALLCAVLVLVAALRRSNRLAVAAPILLFAVSLLAGSAYPAFIQQFRVSPNEIALERPFIEYNIAFTRRGFGLYRIAESPFPATPLLTRADVEANRDTIDNIRLWDWRPMKQTFSQLQAMRLYYQFVDVDLIRYPLDGQLRPVMISARELNQTQLPAPAQTWINLHLKFTHGFGAVLSPGNTMTAEGLPVFYVRDIPPVAPRQELTIRRPEIYFGELTHNYIIVQTEEQEFNYPVGEHNAWTRYEGEAGIPIGSLFRRVAFGLRFQDYQIIVSGALLPESRIIFRRQIMERVRTIAPFLAYDSDPYLVVADGRLFWIIDAYTTSGGFPYSERHPTGINYIRNSVKVVIDAYHGETTFYVFEPEDPLIQTYGRIFPGLFAPKAAMPAYLREHVRYPADLLRIQAHMLLTYQMQDPLVFYNKEDQWAIPREVIEDRTPAMEPYYAIMRLPGSDRTEFVLMLPFTPVGKQNMVAWLAGRADAPHYGELKLFRFPRGELVLGPMQVEARINQDPVIAQDLTLWGQLGSEVHRGNLLVIPIGNSLIYLEPLYLQARENALPELRRVLLVHGKDVAMEPNLEAALARVFGGEGVRPPGPGEDATDRDLVLRAVRLYREAQARLREGDWAGYGRLIQELGEVLARMEQQDAVRPPGGS
ncbi:MAG TPA: UPF0182 family protein [Clostridiales bacterium UBA8153]|nr:UPF0182 family protein [Clostridiales bacterium UBA8153]